jgi:hypothetical protein
MAKQTKEYKKQQAQGLLDSAMADGALSSKELDKIKSTSGDFYNEYKQSLLDQIKAGDPSTLQLLGASDPAFSAGLFGNPALKGTVYGDIGAKLIKAAKNDTAVDFGAFKNDDMRLLASQLFTGSGDTSLIPAQWQAEVSGQNSYLDANGQPQLTNIGKKAYESGLSGATNLDDYRKQFYKDNQSSLFLNADGSLTDAGNSAFMNFWKSAGIPDRAKAMDAFMGQVDPMYQSTASTAGTDAAGNPLPKNQGDIPEWAANNLTGSTVAPLANENLSALEQGGKIAQQNIDAGDRNAPLRNWMMDFINGGASGNMQASAGAQTDLNQVAQANPYLSASTQLQNYGTADADLARAAQARNTQVNDFERGNVVNANAAQSNGAQVNGFERANAVNANAAGMNAAQIDPSTLAMQKAALAQNTNANTAQIDLNALKMMDAASNPYLGKTTDAISFNDKNKYLGMNNPYLQAAIDYATGDVTRNFNNNVQNSTDAMMARSGAFGGSAWKEAQAENSRQFANELGRTAGNMRMTDYQNQQQLEEADLNRRLSVLFQNQQAQAGDLARNSGLQSQYDAANASAYNNALAQNVAYQNQGNQFNASNANDMSRFNAGTLNNANSANAGSINAALMANAGFTQGANQTNTGALNNAYLQNSQLGTQVNTGNANAFNQYLLNNANLAQNNSQFNAGLRNNVGLQNAQLGTQTNNTNAAAYNQYLLNNANLLQNNRQFNTGQQNNVGLQNSQLGTQNNQFNATAYNQYLNNNANLAQNNNQFNASSLNNMGLQNANAYNSALQNNTNLAQGNNQYNSTLQYQYDNMLNQARLNAAGQFGNLADTRYGDLSALNTVGDQYRNYLQSLMNEQNTNWTNQQNWGQNQNTLLGNIVNQAGSLNGTSTNTANSYLPSINPLSTLGGGLMTAGALFGGTSNPGGTGGGTDNGINMNNSINGNPWGAWGNLGLNFGSWGGK